MTPLLCKEAVDELKLRGHDVHVLTGKAECHGKNIYTKDVSRILEFCPLNKNNKPSSYRTPDMIRWYYREWLEQRRINRLLKKISPDIIFIWATKGFSYSVGIRLMNYPIPFVGYVCGFWLIDHNRSGALRKQYQYWTWSPKSIVGKFLKQLVKRGLSTFIPVDFKPLFFDCIAFNTEMTKAAHNDFKLSKFPAKTICDSIPVDDYLSLPLPNLKKIRRVLFIGRIEPTKDPLTLIEACSQLLKTEEFSDLELYLLGWQADHSYVEKLKTVIARSPSPSSFKFVDPIPYNEIPDFLIQNHLVVVPSKVDALPRSAAESLAAGLPLIVSDKAGITNHLTDNVNALFFPAGNSSVLANRIEEVMNNTELAHQLQKNGRKIAQVSMAKIIDPLSDNNFDPLGSKKLCVGFLF